MRIKTIELNDNFCDAFEATQLYRRLGNFSAAVRHLILMQIEREVGSPSDESDGVESNP